MFLEVGTALGYQAERTFSPQAPTDGVWLTRHQVAELDRIPFAAIEVLVSEVWDAKSIRGSISTLRDAVSASLGILLVHEGELHRVLSERNWADAAIDKEINRITGEVARLAAPYSGVEVWTFAKLAEIYRQTTGKKSRYCVK
ncbi:hypothetical protein [Hyalangium rubrum]|uniref:Uncharacterized protein n=1 Tax=Hyalangium rubrum TaxID=3103134 RepID=A0ABU5HJJ2_9BACT|nr:hypothetical protein [Hyalangium sp. s54d21]MDY7232992.1 hypothetical protein [Hyalangium sp. s54d21]